MGPHFYFDLIRLPRKGWSTFFRCLYLLVLLLGLSVMYEARRESIRSLGDYARFAHAFAWTLIVLQDVIVLLLLPVYVASAVAEERENQTIDALFLSPLTDREIVLGKFAGRLMHLGAIILAGVPLLAFTHLWGNVAVSMLTYHLANTFLMAMTATAICILVSTQSAVVFQAVTNSYPFVFVLGLVGELVAFALPWIIDAFYLKSAGTARYWEALVLLAPAHVFVTSTILKLAMQEMNALRGLETKPIDRKKNASFSLADDRTEKVHIRKGRAHGSYIHALALPIYERALFWKECAKDGTRWSLTWRWLLGFVAAVAVASVGFQLLRLGAGKNDEKEVRYIAGTFAYCAYFIALATYALVIVFETTIAVAREREQNTLEFLLLLPVERREILFVKWLGPLWRNWPILAVSYLGILLGLGSGVYSVETAVLLVLLPWPLLLTLSFVALSLSVTCRRVLYANIVMVGFGLVLIVGHVIAAGQLVELFAAYAYLIFESPVQEFGNVDLNAGLLLVALEQTAFLVLATCCAAQSLRHFRKETTGR